MEYGKDSLSSMIDSSLANTKLECREHKCFVIIPLTNGKTLKLQVNPMSNFDSFYLRDEKKKIEIWVPRFKESENYKLIKGKNQTFSIHPNPTSNQLTIDTELKISEITIVDITGKVINTITTDLNTVNVADLSDGIYFINLITDERTITKKFVKQ